MGFPETGHGIPQGQEFRIVQCERMRADRGDVGRSQGGGGRTGAGVGGVRTRKSSMPPNFRGLYP